MAFALRPRLLVRQKEQTPVHDGKEHGLHSDLQFALTLPLLLFLNQFF